MGVASNHWEPYRSQWASREGPPPQHPDYYPDLLPVLLFALHLSFSVVRKHLGLFWVVIIFVKWFGLLLLWVKMAMQQNGFRSYHQDVKGPVVLDVIPPHYTSLHQNQTTPPQSPNTTQHYTKGKTQLYNN